tara:strand:- start:102 stop:335 length:234 start_codon:yes stop_codon:yes gene_type:complete
MTLLIKLFISILILIVITVPWFYTAEANPVDEGLPNWFIYSLCMTVVFSLFVSFAIGRFWDQLEGENIMDSDSDKKD